jgi:hypothetical protein
VITRRWPSHTAVLCLTGPAATRVWVRKTAKSLPCIDQPRMAQKTAGARAKTGLALASRQKGLGPADHVRRRDLQHFTNPEHRAECGALNSAFDQADVRPIQAARQRELFLGNVPRAPKFAQAITKRLFRAGGRVNVLAVTLDASHPRMQHGSGIQ